MKYTTAPFREPYIKGSKDGIPKDRYETDYVEFEDGDYRLGDLKAMGWTLEVFRPGNANDLYLFYEATNQPKERDGGGLKFLALENIDGDGDPDNLELKVFAYGYGYADGIRHIYYGSGHQKGYFYYPPLAAMAQVLLRVEELSQIYCKSVEAYAQSTEALENYINH